MKRKQQELCIFSEFKHTSLFISSVCVHFFIDILDRSEAACSWSGWFSPELESFFSRDSDLSTSFRDEEMLKKMRRCLNISTSFLNISTSYVIKTNISTSFLNIHIHISHFLFFFHSFILSFFHSFILSFYQSTEVDFSTLAQFIATLRLTIDWHWLLTEIDYISFSLSTEINNHHQATIVIRQL